MMTIARFPDWRSRFAAFIETRRRAALADCGLFAADGVEAMTGVDLAAPFRGKYATIEEGLALIRATGHADLCAYVATALHEIAPALSAIGDVMALPAPSGWALGLNNGERVLVPRGDGIGTIAREQAQRAFKVP